MGGLGGGWGWVGGGADALSCICPVPNEIRLVLQREFFLLDRRKCSLWFFLILIAYKKKLQPSDYFIASIFSTGV